ncbi:Ltp family lipoprotein [Corynebacterium freiburgense]|uniref:Ltp family lipoprotein n=1 Tax=Corynebacterium freiburgense TaxID=556548 RepID=UPI000688872D|nr:Ltp family lipoprotein [Corynebacterium freiburgense]WJZ02569.1 Host cell surface-exposed lipoprotein [Corynebacterium freiburgense]
MTDPNQQNHNPYAFNPGSPTPTDTSNEAKQPPVVFGSTPTTPQQPQFSEQPQSPQQPQPAQQPHLLQPPQPTKKKKTGLIVGLIAIAVLLIFLGIAILGAAYYLINSKTNTPRAAISTSQTQNSRAVPNTSASITPDPVLTEAPTTRNSDAGTPGVKNDDKDAALQAAKQYSDYLNLSKKEIYKILINPEAENFTEQAAQYAVDNLQTDWKKNALEQAKIYQNELHMTPEEIYTQLTSEFGGGFTPEEARYAVDHL